MGNSFKDKPCCVCVWWGFAFSAGLMASPDNFVRIGNFFGQSGFAGLLLVFLFALFYVMILKITPQQFSSHPQDRYNFSLVFAFCVKLIALNFIATGLLVTSGFAFNEVFLYWFPNFGFAFILLGVLLGIQFLPKKTTGININSKYLRKGFIMKPFKKKSILTLFFINFLIIFFLAGYASAKAMKMNKEELKSLMDTTTNISIIDVRRGKDWSSSEFKIKGAKRADPSNFSAWSNDFPKENTLVLYCA